MSAVGRTPQPASPENMPLAGNMPLGLWLLWALDLYRDGFPPLMYEPHFFRPQPPRPSGADGTPEPTEYMHPDRYVPDDIYSG